MSLTLLGVSSYFYGPTSSGGMGADVGFDAATAAIDGASASTRTVTLVIGSSSDRAVFVAPCWLDQAAGNATVSTVISNIDGALNIVAGTLQTAVWAATYDVGIVWYQLLNPTSTTHTFTIAWNELVAEAGAGAISFYNVNQGTPTGTPTTSDQSGNTSYSQVIASANGDIVLGGLCTPSGSTSDQAVTAGDQRAEALSLDFQGTAILLGTRAATGTSQIISYTFRDEAAQVSGFAVKKA